MARLQWQICLVYLGDVIVCGRDSDEYQAGLKFKPSKCFLLQPRVPPLGHVISAEGVSTDPANIEASQQWSVPLKFNDVRSFLGLASYYRRFIQNFAEIVAPLDRLTAKTTERFKWSPDCDLAFGGLNEKLVSAPVLAFPCFDQEFVVDCDARDNGLGAVTSQWQDGGEKVIVYASRVLEDRKRRYNTTKKMLIMVYVINHFRHYLYGRPFKVRTDHDALKSLQSFKELEGQVARWLETLALYGYTIEHRPGKKHQNADALSRNPLPVAVPDQAVETNTVDNRAGLFKARLSLPRVSENFDFSFVPFWLGNFFILFALQI